MQSVLKDEDGKIYFKELKEIQFTKYLLIANTSFYSIVFGIQRGELQENQNYQTDLFFWIL